MNEQLTKCAEYAARHGDLRWFIDNCAPDLSDPLDITKGYLDENFEFQADRVSEVCQLAAYHDYFYIIEWLVTESHQEIDLTVANNYIVRYAAAYGNFEVVKWLVEESGQDINLLDVDNSAVLEAAAYGHLEIVKWLINESGQDVDVTAQDNYAIKFAVKNEQFETLQWLINDSWKCGQKLFDSDSVAQVFTEVHRDAKFHCPDYLKLQPYAKEFTLLRELGYSPEEAVTELSNTLFAAQSSKTRKL